MFTISRTCGVVILAACPPPQAAMAPKITTPQVREIVNMISDVFMTVFLSA